MHVMSTLQGGSLASRTQALGAGMFLPLPHIDLPPNLCDPREVIWTNIFKSQTSRNPVYYGEDGKVPSFKWHSLLMSLAMQYHLCHCPAFRSSPWIFAEVGCPESETHPDCEESCCMEWHERRSQSVPFSDKPFSGMKQHLSCTQLPSCQAFSNGCCLTMYLCFPYLQDAMIA